MTDLAPSETDAGTHAEGPFLFGGILNGEGGIRTIDWAEAQTWTGSAPGETLWLHLNRTHPETAGWLKGHLDLPGTIAALLTSEETRPRAVQTEKGLLTILRGINFNPGADREDMIAMQIWSAPGLVITLRRRRLQSPRDILGQLETGDGPKTADDLLTQLIEVMVGKIGLAIIDMNDRIDRLETLPDDSEAEPILKEISEIRRDCLALRRYMSPEHDALLEIGRTAPDWISDSNRLLIRESADRLKRFLDDLDVSKESAIVLQDDIDSRMAAQSNQTMYMLSIVAAIFLPLSFITGLLGINVGGMPGVDSGSAFWITVVLLVLLLALQLYVFRKLKWL
ncbi:MAG: zinc transporter ZntB [Hyphomonadaceae bacterium]|nr:zinc transporter ZntB [Hyphomonadaceae bacterium]